MLSVSILCFNQLETTKKCVDHLLKTRIPEIEFILTDNGSSDGTLDYLTECKLPNKKVIHHETNLGFGEGHNYALPYATGELFLALNNDLLIKDPDWVEKASFQFSDPKVAIVGLAGTPSSLKTDGQGYLGHVKDYVEGSFLVGRTGLFKEHGLFSHAIKMMCFDDSDLTLRYRQMGYKIAYCKIGYTHIHSVTQRAFDREERKRLVTHNQKVFLSRWQQYLATRKFTNRILVQLTSIGIGDVIAGSCVLEGLQKDHPTAKISVESHFPELFYNNPLVSTSKKIEKAVPSQWDRVLILNPNYGAKTPLPESYVEAAYTTIENLSPKVYLTELEAEGARLFLEDRRANVCTSKAPKVLLSTQMSRVEWQGRNWSWDYSAALIKGLKHIYGKDIFIIEMGRDIQSTGEADLDLVNRTSLREAMAVTAAIDVVVSIDSLFLHIAQVFGKPLVGLFGATSPAYRILPSHSNEVVNSGIPCLGCYHEKQSPGFNKCSTKEECMSGITPEQVVTALQKIILH